MKASLHQPFFTIVPDTLIERHVVSGDIGNIDSPTREGHGLINGCGISMELETDSFRFHNRFRTVGLRAATTEVFFYAR